VEIDENGQIMGNSLGVGSSLWLNEFTVVSLRASVGEAGSIGGLQPLIIKTVVEARAI